MKPVDKADFAAVMARAWRIYGKTLHAEDAALWFDLLEEHSLEAVALAFKRHMTDPQAGQYLPKPADLIRHMSSAQADDGHPGPEEAWGMLLRFVNDERETGLLTEEMRRAWEACGPILSLGDEVGARMCFLEIYRKALQQVLAERRPPRWGLTLGSDPVLRQQAIEAAVQARRISADYARTLLPAPVASLEQVAGLLEHSGRQPEPGQPSLSARLRALAAQLRASQAEDDNAAMRAEQERRAAIEARKPAPKPQVDDEYREAA
jgi:hypothetical protein